LAHAMAVAAPKPSLPPVMITTLPVKPKSIGQSTTCLGFE
jgi:hypothetical protein